MSNTLVRIVSRRNKRECCAKPRDVIKKTSDLNHFTLRYMYLITSVLLCSVLSVVFISIVLFYGQYV